MFWQEACPAARVTRHRHDPECETHLPLQCCFCGQVSPDVEEADLTLFTPKERRGLMRVARAVAGGYYKP